MKDIFLVLFIVFSPFAFGQQIHKSEKYNYQIEIPKGYIVGSTVGKNTDLHAGNKDGNSIVIVVKKLPSEAENSSAYQLFDLSKDKWEQLLSETMPHPKFVKSGKSKIDNKDAFWMHYTSQQDSESKMYHINYVIFCKGLQYIITETCFQKDLDKNMPYFMRSIQSFKI